MTTQNRQKSNAKDFFFKNRDQTGFMKGRYIGENVRIIFDTIAYLNNTDNIGFNGHYD